MKIKVVPINLSIYLVRVNPCGIPDNPLGDPGANLHWCPGGVLGGLGQSHPLSLTRLTGEDKVEKRRLMSAVWKPRATQ